LRDVCFEDGVLAVSFQNGDVVRLLPSLLTDAAVDWARARVVDEVYVEASSETGLIEIPGERIRLATNPEYARYREQVWRSSVGPIAYRLRSLRERSGISGAELARRTGIKQPNIVRIERGHHEPGIATVGRILAAIGASWGDLTLSDEEYVEYLAARQ
jgi:DNA-binding XRE family transcriptional regulator